MSGIRKAQSVFSLLFLLSVGSGACGLCPAMGREGGLYVVSHLEFNGVRLQVDLFTEMRKKIYVPW